MKAYVDTELFIKWLSNLLVCMCLQWTVNGHLRVGFFTLRPIPAGTELTFDYQFEQYG